MLDTGGRAHRVFSEIGTRLEMHYQAENFMHAWAAVDDIGYQSIKLNEREEMLITDRNAMEWLAAEHGNKLPDFYNDH
jgi:hypothetical protein